MHDRAHAALVGAFAGEELVEQDAAGVDVGTLVDDLAHELLGRHVGRGAHDGAGLGHAAGFDACDAEIGDLGLADIVGDHDVGGLDVAMDDAASVAERETGEDLAHEAEGFGDRKAQIAVEHLLERAARDELHDDVGDLVGLAVVEHSDDIRMGEATSSLRLALEAVEAFDSLLVVGVGEAHGLYGHPAADDRVPAIIDGAHGTTA